MEPYNEYGLMNREVSYLKKFREAHSSCDPSAREEMIEEDCAPTLCEVILRMTSIGMVPSARCLVCGAEESIACADRLDSL